MLNEIINEIIDEIVNEIINEIITEIVNEIVNEIVIEIVIELTNEVINEITNGIINEIINETIYHIINEVINEIMKQITNQNPQPNYQSRLLQHQAQLQYAPPPQISAPLRRTPGLQLFREHRQESLIHLTSRDDLCFIPLPLTLPSTPITRAPTVASRQDCLCPASSESAISANSALRLRGGFKQRRHESFV